MTVNERPQGGSGRESLAGVHRSDRLEGAVDESAQVISDRMRDGAKSWVAAIERIETQGLDDAPLLTVADGPLRLWKAA